MEQIWLIKSGNQILGPYSTDELRSLVQQRTVSLIDEAKRPLERWAFIRQIQDFRDLAGAVRDRQSDHQEETVGLTQTTASTDSTVSVTESVTHELECTPEPSLVRAQAGTQLGSKPQDARIKASAPQVRKEFNFFSGKVIGFLLVMGVIGLGYFFWNKKDQLQEQQKREIEAQFQMARSFAEQAQHLKALEIYDRLEKRVGKLPEQDQLSRLKMMVHQPELAAQALSLYSNLQGLSQGSLVRDLSLLRALVLVQQKKWNEARLDLEALLRIDSQDDIAKVNLAALNLFSGRVQEAWLGLADSSFAMSRIPQLSLLGGWAALRWPDDNSKEAVVTAALERLKPGPSEYAFERAILRSALQFQFRSREMALASIQDAFSADPLESDQFLSDLLLDQQVLRWSDYLPICERMVSAFSYQAEARVLKVFCHFRSGKRDLWEPELKLLARDMGGLPLVQAAQLSIDLRLGQGLSIEAQGLQAGQNDPAFVSLAFGQACFSQKDFECAEKHWLEALSKAPEQPQALWGLASLYRERGNQVASRDHLRRASLAAPGYLRLLELRGASNW